MTEFKRIDEKPVWLIMKKYSGGAIEIVGAYWLKETAQKVAVNNLPKPSDNFAITLTEINLFGSMQDYK